MRVNGFSLMELCIVIALCALLVSLGTSFFAVHKRMLVRMDFDALYAVCVSLAQRAVALQQEQKLVFDGAAHAYSVNGQRYTMSAAYFGVPIGAMGPPSDPHAIITDPVHFRDHTILFYPDGKIQAGTVYLTDSDHTIGYALTCPIAQFSYIRRYQYMTTWEVLA